MNFNGENVITAIVKKLNKDGCAPTDSRIVQEIKKLNRHELAELINFCDVAKWIRDGKR